jgi:hypothetical protein
LEFLEGFDVDVVGECDGGVGGAAFGHDAGGFESGLQAADGAHHEDEESGGGKLGPGDVPESLPRRCAVDVGGFVELGRDVRQCGEVEEHVGAADQDPDAHEV